MTAIKCYFCLNLWLMSYLMAIKGSFCYNKDEDDDERRKKRNEVVTHRRSEREVEGGGRGTTKSNDKLRKGEGNND